MASETLPPETAPSAPTAAPTTGSRWLWVVPLILGIVLLYAARDIITPFIIAVVVAYLLDPFVATVHRYTHAPRALVVVVMALLSLATLGLLITLLVRVAADQGQGFVTHLPGYLQTAVDNINTLIAPTTVQIPKDAIPGLNGKGLPDFNVGAVLTFAASFAASTGQGLLDFLLSFVSTIYLLLDGHHLANGLQRFFPLEQRPRLAKVMRRVRQIWSSYIRAQIILAAGMAVASWAILQFGFNLPFAVIVGIAIGLLETIPIVGPLVALTLAAVVALATLGIFKAVLVVAALYALRLVEDNVVIPQVLGHAIHLPAIVTIFAVTLGGIVAGLVGLILAVPIAAAIKVVIDEYYPHPHPALAGEAAGESEKARHRRAKKHTDDLAAVTAPVAAPATAPPPPPDAEASTSSEG